MPTTEELFDDAPPRRWIPVRLSTSLSTTRKAAHGSFPNADPRCHPTRASASLVLDISRRRLETGQAVPWSKPSCPTDSRTKESRQGSSDDRQDGKVARCLPHTARLRTVSSHKRTPAAAARILRHETNHRILRTYLSCALAYFLSARPAPRVLLLLATTARSGCSSSYWCLPSRENVIGRF